MAKTLRKRLKKAFRKKFKRYKAKIRRPKYDSSYKVTCDCTLPIRNKDCTTTYPGGA